MRQVVLRYDTESQKWHEANLGVSSDQIAQELIKQVLSFGYSSLDTLSIIETGLKMTFLCFPSKYNKASC